MSTLFKTLFGGAASVAIAAIVMAAEAPLLANDQAVSAALAVPPLVLTGVAWLATR
jgi:hypothetical protein